MILNVIVLSNFRQYYKEQRVFFSRNSERNVTVIHGENGTGKTALLGAFNWCLYGRLDLPDPDHLINERTATEAKVGEYLEAYVNLRFSNNGRDYSVTRRVKAKKTSNTELQYYEPELELEYIDEEGKTKSPKNPQEVIDQIIPSDLRRYFFFDGERIDNLTKKEGAKDIQKAIKVLMGLEILERASTHLGEVQKRFRHESASYGDSETQQLVKEIEELEGRIEEQKLMREELHKEKRATNTQLTQVRDRLRELEESSELQNRRDELQSEEENIRLQMQDIRKKIRQIVSKQGYLAFCTNVINEIHAFLEEKRLKSEIPSGLKQQFVEDLLENGECICGTRLSPDTEPYNNVRKWLERVPSKELEDAYLELIADVKVLKQAVPRLFEDLQEAVKNRESLRFSLTNVREELSQVSSQLEEKDVEEVSSLARKDNELSNRISEIDQRIGKVSGEIERLENETKKKSSLLKKKKAEGDKAALARRRMEACENVKAVVEEILKYRAKEVQERLQEKVSEVYSTMLRKRYQVKIDGSYSLNVFKLIGDYYQYVPMSQGERQVTSLAFIGAIVSIAKEQAEHGKNNPIQFSGGLYPIVMDSPFGQMDEFHRSRTSRSIPKLAHQVIIMVSSSQWNGPVQSEMKQYVGREYTLDYCSPETNPAITYEYTEIKEVDHAKAHTA